MEYDKYFDAEGQGGARKQVRRPGRNERGESRGVGDRRDGKVYVYNDKIELAVNVALATGRPMLVRGPSGCGKSSLARHVAARLGWRYYEWVITSRTQARDMLWVFDSLRRLSDAQARRPDAAANPSGEPAGNQPDEPAVVNPLDDPATYVEPGVLWWAFDPASAIRRGRPKGSANPNPADDPGEGPKGGDGAVVLLDEIDKADPDVPNNLLVPLGSFEFKVSETNSHVTAQRPLLLVITTNDERVLPAAFMRRCVVLELDPPDESLLVRIAEEHYGPDEKNIYRAVAERVVGISREGVAPGKASPSKASPAAAQIYPSAAEYLDTVRACLDLGIRPEDEDERWKALTKATLAKRQSPS